MITMETTAAEVDSVVDVYKGGPRAALPFLGVRPAGHNLNRPEFADLF